MKTRLIIKTLLTIGIVFVVNQNSLYAQANWSTTGLNTFAGAQQNRIGTDGANPPNVNKLDIRFFTAGAERMRLIGEAGPNLGFLGIGLPAPLYQLDVQNNINVNTTGFGNGYRINGFTVLQTPGFESTFVGRGSGANTVFTPLAENTFVGFNAGGSNISGVRNTYLGRAAGFSMLNGRFNTMIGCDAGLNLAIGDANTFVGEHAGFNQVSGNNNTYVGSHSGAGLLFSTGNNNTFIGMNCGPSNVNGNGNTFTGVQTGNSCDIGIENCFYGSRAGLLTQDGSGNVFLGFLAGRFNLNGNDNTFVGRLAGVPSGPAFHGLNNANAIGVLSLVRANNTMILGNNLVNVGIGLSNDVFANGPTDKLEIDAGLSANPLSPTDPSPNGLPGQSGLTFRDLHSGNTPSLANGFALSVNGSGEVILVPAGGPNSFATCNGPIPALASNVALDLNNFNLHFSGTTTNSRVGIGTSCPSVLLAKFNVVESSGVTTGSLATRIANTNNSVAGQVFGIVSTLNPSAP